MRRVPAKYIEARLSELRFPQRIYHGTDEASPVALVADREMAEALANEDALGAIGTRTKIFRLYLAKPMSELRTTLRHKRMPIAEDNRTVFREDLGNGRFTYSHNMRRSEAFNRPVAA